VREEDQAGAGRPCQAFWQAARPLRQMVAHAPLSGTAEMMTMAWAWG
jgi:hypothetical protein